MKNRSSCLMTALMVAGLALTAAAPTGAEPPEEGATDLQGPEAFGSITDPTDRAIAMFVESGKVLTHPRCVNCHPEGESPLQGEDGRLHQPPVVRGRGGIGVTGMRCRTCHMAENYDPGRVPGAPHWLLAPESMAWEDLTLNEICEQIKDPERNGGRSLEDIVEHVTEDALVGWGWEPGADRQPAPGTQALFAALIRGWAALGGPCP